MKRLLFFALHLLLAALACNSAQRGAVGTMVAGGVPPPEEPAAAATETPSFSAITLPTLAPTMDGPLGTLTAIAPFAASPVPDKEPYVIVNRGKPHFVEFHAFW